MKKMLKLTVTQVRVFPVDVLGFEYFRTSGARELISKRYGFSGPAISPDGFPFLPADSTLVFTAGEFVHDNKKNIIEGLTIENRRILFTVQGTSEEANLFFDDLCIAFTKLDTRNDRPDYEPLITADETVCVAQLDIPFTALLSDGLVKMQSEMEKAARLAEAEVELFPISMKFVVRYTTIPSALSRKKVTLSDKEIMIEIRSKTDPSEQIYYTKSPFSSSVHLRLIEEMEKRLGSQLK